MFVRAMIGMIVAVLASSASLQAHAEDPERPLLVPLIGIPYVSTTESGQVFAGSIDIDEFRTDGSELRATGELRFGRRSIPLEFPVEVVSADCTSLELNLGPPPFGGLQDPLFLAETRGNSELRQSNFCEIAQANTQGELDELVSLLNEEELLAAGFQGGSCKWYDALACVGLASVCGVSCAIGPGSCLNCYLNVGAPFCIDCVCPNCCSELPPGTPGC